MNCHLLVPCLLSPVAEDDRALGTLRLPALEKLLARARRIPAEPLGLPGFLCRAFGVPRQQDWPVAPLTLTLDCGTPGHAYWLRADPVHFQLKRDHVVLADSGAFSIGQAEANALTETLNRHFAGDGFTFYPLRPDRWYLRLPRVPDLRTRELAEVTGQQVDRLLPGGSEARAFSKLCTEIQMLFHEHPVNHTREAAGNLPVNGVWLWGGGTDPRQVQRPYSAVYARDALALALAGRSGADCGEPPSTAAEWLAQCSGRGEQLLVLEDLQGAAQYGDSGGWQEALARVERDWIAPLLAAVARKSVARLSLHPLPLPWRFDATAADLWKPWRRPAPVARQMEALRREASVPSRYGAQER